jgi:hypothetical protein
MGVDTKLYINPRYTVENIRDCIEAHLKTKVTLEVPENMSGMYMLLFKDGNDDRQMYVFPSSNTPIGIFTQLHLRHWGRAVEIMRAIGEVFGGLLQPEDCTEEFEMIYGKLNEGNGIPYFIKYALINNYMTSEDDMDGLKQAIDEWYKKYRQ